MYILDTDYITVISRGGSEGEKLSKLLGKVSSARQVVTTIITYEEQTRGWLSEIKKAERKKQQANTYELFKKHLEIYCKIPVLEFNQESEQEFYRLKEQHPTKPGTMDLKIAAIALTNNAVVLTKNIRDFDQIKNLSVENWL